ncbi:MAG TPA: hypothetical protein ENI92_01280 [Bacteroidetes bacterium]|nr:hypothetical protein [Bacteroidota bacterium]
MVGGKEPGLRARHMILWYRPGKDRPRQVSLGAGMLRVLAGFVILIAIALILETVFYASLARRAIEQHRLAKENAELRRELARVDQLESELRELQRFGYQVKRSLTEGADLDRILKARKAAVGEALPRGRAVSPWTPNSGTGEEDLIAEAFEGVRLGALWRVANLPDRWPVVGFLTRGFEISAVDPAHSHTGLDIAVPRGTPVRAVADGVVVAADWSSRLGNRVILDHGGGVLSIYGHNEMLLVRPQDRVKAGSPIALSGTSGISTAPHLHFEIWVDGRAVDPRALLPERGEDYGLRKKG